MATKKRKNGKQSGGRSRSTSSRGMTKAQQSARQQAHALILLAVSVLMFCLAIIKGESLWTWLHNVLLGLFSFSAFIIPVILAFVAIMLAMEKETATLNARVWHHLRV